MTKEKAREILTDLVRDQPTFSPDDRREAVLEGITALDILILLQSGGWAITRITSPFRPKV